VRHDEVTHGILSEALDHAEDVMTEGRGRIQDLRLAAGDDSDLPVSLAAVGEELSRSSAGVSFRAVVEGNAITIEPTVRDELYRIGREALLNAFHHGRARSIELQFLFGATDLRIRVRDDGVGFDASTLRTGSRPGHWGLQGMRERARSIGAQIDIWSRPEAGTEIELRLPAAAAYVPPRRATRWLPLLRLAGGRR
jgi:signal transduction histidine kinase